MDVVASERERDPARAGEIDERFKRSMAALSDQLAARSAAEGPTVAPEPTRDMRNFEQPARHISPVRIMAFALLAIATTTVLYLMRSPMPTQAPPQQVNAPFAATVPAPLPPPPPAPAVVDPQPAAPPALDKPAAPPPAPKAEAKPVIAPPEPAELAPYEVMEVQTRLKALGIEPNMLMDGINGKQTKATVRRYEEARGLPPTGNINHELLNRLRSEPASNPARGR